MFNTSVFFHEFGRKWGFSSRLIVNCASKKIWLTNANKRQKPIDRKEMIKLSEKSSSPEMDRTRRLFDPGNKEANRMGWLFCKVNLGGLGRNRTTDTPSTTLARCFD